MSHQKNEKINSLKKKISYFFKKNEFLFLLIVLLSFILVPAFFTYTSIKDELIYTLLLLILIVGVLELWDSKYLFRLGLFVGIFSLIIINVNLIVHDTLIFTLRMGSLIFFFLILSYHIFVRMIKSEKVSTNIIYAAVNGYLLLGLIGGMGFRLIEKFYPLSFVFESGLEAKIDDLTYFSFVTLSSIGYGDITPVTPPGQSLAIFISICGQMYMAIVIGIIIGKFILRRLGNS